MVKMLIENKAKVNIQDKYGCTPLMRSGEYGKLKYICMSNLIRCLKRLVSIIKDTL